MRVALPILFHFYRNSSTSYVIWVQKAVNAFHHCASESPRGSFKDAFAKAKSYSDPWCLGMSLGMWIFITCGISMLIKYPKLRSLLRLTTVPSCGVVNLHHYFYSWNKGLNCTSFSCISLTSLFPSFLPLSSYTPFSSFPVLTTYTSGSHIRITGECFRNTDGWVPSWRDSDLIGLRVFF